MSEDLNAVEEAVKVIEAEEAAVEEEIVAVTPENKAASRGKKFQAEPEVAVQAAAEAPVELEEVVEVVVPEPTPTSVAVTPVASRGGMSISIRNRR